MLEHLYWITMAAAPRSCHSTIAPTAHERCFSVIFRGRSREPKEKLLRRHVRDRCIQCKLTIRSSLQLSTLGGAEISSPWAGRSAVEWGRC